MRLRHSCASLCGPLELLQAPPDLAPPRGGRCRRPGRTCAPAPPVGALELVDELVDRHASSVAGGWPGPLGHDLDARGASGAVVRLERQHLAQRADRDLELVERRLARRQPLEPEARARAASSARGCPCACRRSGSARRRARRSPAAAGSASTISQYQARPAEEREDEDRDHHHPEQERRPAARVDEAEALHALGLELLAGLVGVDRLVLGGVVLEDAPQVGQQRDERRGRGRRSRRGSALDDHEPGPVVVDREPVREQRRRRP